MARPPREFESLQVQVWPEQVHSAPRMETAIGPKGIVKVTVPDGSPARRAAMLRQAH